MTKLAPGIWTDWQWPKCTMHHGLPSHITAQLSLDVGMLWYCVDCDWYRLEIWRTGTLEGFGCPMCRNHSEEEIRAFAEDLLACLPAHLAFQQLWTPRPAERVK